MFHQMQAQNQAPQNLAGTTPLGLKGARARYVHLTAPYCPMGQNPDFV